MKNKLILITISLALVLCQYNSIYRVVMTGTHPEYKISAFTSIQSGGMRKYHETVTWFWQHRIGSNFTANIFTKICGVEVTKDKITAKLFCHSLALWGAIWLLLTFAIIMVFSEKPLLFILGLFAATQWNWTPAADWLFLPWDSPVLFWWTTILLVDRSKHYRVNIVLIPLAVIFKETSVVLCLLTLFRGKWRNNIKQFIIIAVISMTVKTIMDFLSGTSHAGATLSLHYDSVCRSGHYWKFDRNLWSLYQFNFQYVLAAAAGIGVTLYLLPKEANKYKVIGVVYLVSIFLSCVITEARLFNELIPLFFVGMEASKLNITSWLSKKE